MSMYIVDNSSEKYLSCVPSIFLLQFHHMSDIQKYKTTIELKKVL